MKKILYKKFVKPLRDKVLLIPLGDIHYGHQNCDVGRFEKFLQWIYKTKNAYVLGMGDLLEMSTRDSIGSGVYEQTEFAQGQLEKMVEYLYPIAKEGRLLGLLDGNHEQRIYKRTGLNLTKVMAKLLDTEYLGYGINLRLNVGGTPYKIYATHGSSNSKLPHTKLRCCIDLAKTYDADIYMHAHVHELANLKQPFYVQNTRHMTMEEKDRFFILTGSYLNYFDGYAEQKNMQPSKLGTPVLELLAGKYGVKITNEIA